jgi:hypothetical protein
MIPEIHSSIHREFEKYQNIRIPGGEGIRKPAICQVISM